MIPRPRRPRWRSATPRDAFGEGRFVFPLLIGQRPDRVHPDERQVFRSGLFEVLDDAIRHERPNVRLNLFHGKPFGAAIPRLTVRAPRRGLCAGMDSCTFLLLLGRTTHTGQVACRTTRSAVLPNKTRSSPLCPCVSSRIKSMPLLRAVSRMATADCPRITVVVQCTDAGTKRRATLGNSTFAGSKASGDETASAAPSGPVTHGADSTTRSINNRAPLSCARSTATPNARRELIEKSSGTRIRRKAKPRGSGFASLYCVLLFMARSFADRTFCGRWHRRSPGVPPTPDRLAPAK